MKTRKEIVKTAYLYHRSMAAKHLDSGNTDMLNHHLEQMIITGDEYRELLAAVDAKPIEKPSAVEQVKFVAMSGYDSRSIH